MRIAPNSKLVFIGDSITDCSRARLAAPGDDQRLGYGYVAIASALIGAVYPQRKIQVVNVGISGNTVRDLAGRWEQDVTGQKPDWLSVMIGINDVWRQFDPAKMHKEAVYPEEFESTLSQLLARARPNVLGLVLMTPFFLETDRADPMRAQMDAYGAIVSRLAPKFDAVLVDTQAAFDAVLKYLHTSTLADDRVHPNQVGHAVLARAFLSAVGFQW